MRALHLVALVALLLTHGVGASTDGTSAPPPHVMLATPCYTGTVHEGYFLSVVAALQRHGNGQGPRLSVSTVASIADLPKARGALIAEFLRTRHYTHALFVDADVSFDAGLPERLVSSGFDVVAAMYAKKHVDIGKLRSGASVVSAQEYPVEFLFEKDSDGAATGASQGKARTDNRGFVEVRRVGAGFLMVSRSALQRLVDAHPELWYECVVPVARLVVRLDVDTPRTTHPRASAPPDTPPRDPPSGETHYALFHNVLQSSGTDGQRVWVSEDFAFCDRWRALGGEVWVDALSGLNHTGRFTFPSAGWVDRFRKPPPRGEL